MNAALELLGRPAHPGAPASERARAVRFERAIRFEPRQRLAAQPLPPPCAASLVQASSSPRSAWPPTRASGSAARCAPTTSSTPPPTPRCSGTRTPPSAPRRRAKVCRCGRSRTPRRPGPRPPRRTRGGAPWSSTQPSSSARRARSCCASPSRRRRCASRRPCCSSTGAGSWPYCPNSWPRSWPRRPRPTAADGRRRSWSASQTWCSTLTDVRWRGRSTRCALAPDMSPVCPRARVPTAPACCFCTGARLAGRRARSGDQGRRGAHRARGRRLRLR
eukprot:2039005-Prymnesium_polylepis.1